MGSTPEELQHRFFNIESPKKTGSLTALYGTRFRLDTRNNATYLWISDIETVDTLFPDFLTRMEKLTVQDSLEIKKTLKTAECEQQ